MGCHACSNMEHHWGTTPGVHQGGVGMPRTRRVHVGCTRTKPDHEAVDVIVTRYKACLSLAYWPWAWAECLVSDASKSSASQLPVSAAPGKPTVSSEAPGTRAATPFASCRMLQAPGQAPSFQDRLVGLDPHQVTPVQFTALVLPYLVQEPPTGLNPSCQVPSPDVGCPSGGTVDKPRRSQLASQACSGMKMVA